MAEEQQQQSNVVQESNQAIGGLNMDQTINQIPKGKLTYALNAAVENFDANSVNYQNEPANEFCLYFPEGYHLIGTHFIIEQNKHIFFLVNPETGDSEIGYMDNNDCIYHTYINSTCLNFDINYPIHKAVHKITNCSTEIYWTDGLNPRRFLDLNKIPYITTIGDTICDVDTIKEIDCNKLKVQPNFSIPKITIKDITNVGSLIAGTYQFAVQYCDVAGDPYTSYYSVTNPTSIANTQITTPDFNYPVGKAIVFDITDIDATGYFQYFNVAVIKTINGVTSVELINTYFIDDTTKTITYSGQNQTQIKLTIDNIFEKFPYYEVAQDLTAVQDVLVWDNLSSIDRINYQKIANKINLYWQTYALPANEDYSSGLNTTNLRGYLRDEVYAFEITFLLRNGKQTDSFHIPGREIGADAFLPNIPDTNPDFVGVPDEYVAGIGYSPYWKIYNTATVLGLGTGDKINNAIPYEYGEMAYWESTETYPCNEEQWGELAGKPIRHHKMPDVLVSPIFKSGTPHIELDGTYTQLKMENEVVYPLGVRINVSEVEFLINNSDLTDSQKGDIIGFKITRGDRATNQGVIAKGILRNVGEYTREETPYFFSNYPYNDLTQDPFLLEKNGAYNAQCVTYKYKAIANGTVTYTDCITNTVKSKTYVTGDVFELCSLSKPIATPSTTQVAGEYKVTWNAIGFQPYIRFVYFNCSTGNFTIGYLFTPSDVVYVCSYLNPYALDGATINVNPVTTVFKYKLSSNSSTTFQYTDAATGYSKLITITVGNPVVISSYSVPKYVGGDTGYIIEQVSFIGNENCYPNQLDAFTYSGVGYRHVFNSPETSFGQPFLGNVLKLENVLYGAGSAHFVEVKKHALYKFLTKEAQEDALQSSADIASTTGTLDAGGMFAAYQAYLTIYINGITRRNYTYSYNSIAKYNYWSAINNNLGIKQRTLDIAQYLIPGVQNVGDTYNINNYNRESSVYLRTDLNKTVLPFPSKTPSLLTPTSTSAIVDRSRYTISEKNNCEVPNKEFDITVVSYYASLKTIFPNQWGPMYSYPTIDTGYQAFVGESKFIETIFGGDTFISKFSYKNKLPFFIDNRVGAPDDSDIFYDEIGNIAYPKYWFSARSILSDFVYGGTTMKNIVSIKAHFFDCPNNQFPDSSPGRTYYDGKIYLFAYGIPTFYCESAINVDLRQAFNNKEGDFYPHVSTGIPDNWLQESVVPIILDNTYYYNVTFSKQNKENFFSHLPLDWKDQLCYTNFPFRAIYSDRQQSYTDNRINSWLIYRPISFFDFPQNYGKLTSLDGIQNRAILARFENKSLLYNTLLTVETSNPQAAYLGNDTLFRSAPPIDFAETDLGYVGSQNKMILKIPQGQVVADAKRGQIFLISGGNIVDMSSFGSGVNRFMTDHLAFEILRYYPDVNVDNHFNSIGLHGVYDSKYDRVIITKLDYIPQNEWVGKIKYDSVTKEFYIENIYPQVPTSTTTSTTTTLVPGTTTTSTTSTTTTLAPLVVRVVVDLTDPTYFCNKSWTLSYNMNTNSWISFHSYIPNWYIGENNFFYSGLNTGCNLAAIAAEQVLPTTTTTSTTTTIFRDCSLAGITEVRDCSLSGKAVLVYDCTLAGTADVNYDCRLQGIAVLQEIVISCSTPTPFPGGEAYPSTQITGLGTDLGVVNFDFDAYSLPDRFLVNWNGSYVIDTGYRGDASFAFGGGSRATFTAAINGKVDPVTGLTYPDAGATDVAADGYPNVTSPGNGSTSFNKTLASPTIATVYVYAPIAGTSWEYTIYCPTIP